MHKWLPVATLLGISCAIGCFMMCFLANMPLAVMPGMGINAYCT
jgi:xanthine/uracil/vitamin C permease (AzgA family)